MEANDQANRAPNEPAVVFDKDFLLAEYNRLSAEIAEHMKEGTNCINFTIVTSGAIWAWFAANPLWKNAPAALFIPSILTVLWGLRFWALQNIVGNIGRYIKGTETGKGAWEVFLRGRDGNEEKPTDAKKGKNRWQLGAWGALFFGLLFVANGATAYFFNESKSRRADKMMSEDDLKTVATEVAKAILSKQRPQP